MSPVEPANKPKDKPVTLPANKKSKVDECGKKDYSLLSRITFAWLWPYIQKARSPQHHGLTREDCAGVALRQTSQQTSSEFLTIWQETLSRYKSEPKTAFFSGSSAKKEDGDMMARNALYATVWKFRRQALLTSASLQLLHVSTTFMPPFLLEWLSLILKQHDTGRYPLWHGYLVAVALCACLLVSTLAYNRSMWILSRSGMEVRTGMMAAIHGKAFVLSGAARQRFSVGKAVQLMSADVLRMETAWEYVHVVWTGPLQLVVNFCFLYGLLGRSALAGVAVVACFVPVHAGLVWWLGRQRDVVGGITEKRIRLLQEILQGIKIIKYYAWDGVFATRMADLRRDELAGIKKMRSISALSYTLTYSIPVLASAATLAAYNGIFQDTSPSTAIAALMAPEIVFKAVSLFNNLETPLVYIPAMASYAVDGMAAMRRIAAFLDAPTINPDAMPICVREAQWAVRIGPGATFSYPSAEASSSQSSTKERKKQPQTTRSVVPNLHVKELTANPPGAYGIRTPEPTAAVTTVDSSVKNLVHSPEPAIDDDSGGFCLRELDLTIPKGSLVAIVGPVGSGKSSLLEAVLGELVGRQRVLLGSSRIALCPQQPWIQNATVRANILLGQPWNPDRYEAVLEQCALKPDLSAFPHGDQTEIGERGIALSGGQKLRIALARAVYFGADLVLLDDPLSAVDAHVGKTLFEDCIYNGLLADTTRLLVTHHLHVLPWCDLVLVMQEGRIVQQGTYADLLASQSDFAEMLKEFVPQSPSLSNEPDDDETSQESDAESVSEMTEEEEDDGGVQEEHNVAAKDAAHVNQQTPIALSNVSPAVYRIYFEAACKPGAWWLKPVILALGTMLLVEGSRVSRDYWIAMWTANNLQHVALKWRVGVYGLLGVAQALLAWLNSLLFVWMGWCAGKRMHEEALRMLLGAPVRFFDTTPLGRIISRFSKDQDILDALISEELNWLVYALGYLGSSLVQVILASKGSMLVVLVPLMGVGWWLQVCFRAASRQVHRLQAWAFSPLMVNFSESYAGMAVIRAFRAQSFFTRRHHVIVDGVNRAWLLSQGLQRWTSLLSGLMGAVLVGVCAAVCVWVGVSPDMAGMGLTSALDINASMDWCIKQFAETEASMIAVERLNHYRQHLEQEQSIVVKKVAPKEMDDDKQHSLPRVVAVAVSSGWPERGMVVFKGVWLAYKQGQQPVLRGLSFTVLPGQKIAIVGRTGAGKSTILTALFRIIELQQGCIEVDGVDISQVPLHLLRSRLAIVPQEPVLFSGTLRSNLDPLGKHSDADLWLALSRTSMQEAIAKQPGGGLDSQVLLAGENYSIGQRQLLCLTRALLQKSQIIVMDEATASIDMATDAIIQDSLRANFAGCTLLTIAHRLNTIMDYDRVMVLQDGLVKEFGPPLELARQGDTEFAALVSESGINLDDYSSSAD